MDERTRRANRQMEATVTMAVPSIPAPMGGLGPFPDGERQSLVQRLQSIFPGSTKSAIERIVFGTNRQGLEE